MTGISDHLRLPPAGEPERQQPPLYYLLGALVLREAHRRRCAPHPVGLGGARRAHDPHRPRGGTPPLPAQAGSGGRCRGAGGTPPRSAIPGRAINDDNLAWLAGALLVLAGVVVMQSELLTPRLALGTGLAVALAVLAKETVWIFALLLLALVVVRFARQVRAVSAVLLLVPTIVLAAWWFVRNAVEFGSPLPPCIRSPPSGRCSSSLRTGARLYRRDGSEHRGHVWQRRPPGGGFRSSAFGRTAQHRRHRCDRGHHRRRVYRGGTLVGPVGHGAPQGRGRPSRGAPRGGRAVGAEARPPSICSRRRAICSSRSPPRRPSPRWTIAWRRSRPLRCFAVRPSPCWSWLHCCSTCPA